MALDRIAIPISIFAGSRNLSKKWYPLYWIALQEMALRQTPDYIFARIPMVKYWPMVSS